ncbi:3-phosphoshikimate 1-carboxyvinyltransferase [Sedimentibacter sp. zth1]|uniref:3-phosphoshikimate 1-carboxyvinyltransferase n=1 Tax=Sedimentibacter sp. zth1 TaxID=2816908 RepID=UPI001A92D5EB|nr:3-phosphoshikimate 1-carboxyvinyltransferase [Sedimentibacter sp. zth1]QSX06089.1 3-phosphoshikimate 1-carboxyvinyltransferase [Sedimentibacter sp. zth1]
MGKILITPSKLSGEILIPPSKSISHRAIICASLCKKNRISIVDNIILSDDINSTITGIENLGVKIEKLKQVDDRYKLIIQREKDFIELADINCLESGSTLRFLIPISTLFSNKTIFEGKGRLADRSLDTYYKIFDRQGISYSNVDGRLPLTIKGSLKSGDYCVDSNVSSQFLTGLLFTLPLLTGDSKIYVSGNLESRGYIDLTIDTLDKFGIKVQNDNYSIFSINGNQKYHNSNFIVESDYSQAAFFLIANELGSNIDVKGLLDTSKQGDKKIIEIINDINNLKTDLYEVDASQIPDLVPILAVYFSLQNGLKTHIKNAKRLRFKESDRLNAIATQLNLLGADLTELEDGLIINGKEALKGGCSVSSINDHRIAMALAIAATRCNQDIELDSFEAINKSYPNFFNDYRDIGGIFYELDMGK